MITIWGLLLGVPVLAFGGALLFRPETARRFSQWFRSSDACALSLTAAAWFWTAYECDTIGIEAFDRITKIFPGELWILACVLTWLTFAWMRKSLSVRALTGILMLFPAELFKTTHAYRPPPGVAFAAADVFVYFAYVCAIVGMYGMFYPWRLEKGFDIVAGRDWSARAFGALLAAAGAALVAAGVALR
jgi:hypothetical protein